MNYVNLDQSRIIVDLLREFSDSVDFETLKARIMLEAKVSDELATAYVSSWKHNHKIGAIAATVAAVDRAFPRPTTAKLTIVEDGPVHDYKPARTGSIIHQIIEHHKAGLTNPQIIALGFNKSTVGRQVGEYKKAHKN